MMVLTCIAAALTAPSTLPERVSLEGTWRLTQAQRKISIPAAVPGVVQTDLMRARKIPDPFYRDNEKQVQWVGETPWTYSRSFNLTPAFARRRHIVLRCEGLDTLARVQVNGREVARTDNMFRTWEFDVRPLLKPGANSIRIDFEPIEPFLKAHEVQEAFPGKPVQVHGWGYVRKPPFQQGWDFSPKLITMGIWRKIGLVGWDEARLTDIDVVQRHWGGKVRLDVKLAAPGATRAVATASYKGKKVAEAECPISNGGGEAHITVAKPQLWWPNGMGAQNMYDVQVELRDGRNRVLDRGTRRIGLRTITWIAKTPKTPLTLAVNGRRFFAKGSNWVPRDALIVRTTPADEHAMVEKAVSANMNLMRLWGGGFYENDAFLDACDEKGLLVWFEFKFADATYPSFDPMWLRNVKAEAADNVRRVRHHPSIAVYSGNNEVIGFIADKTDPGHMSREDYNLLFHTTLRDIVTMLAPDAAYTPGSPEVGDDHDWDVWHGSATFASYRNVHGFLSEYGFQAFPGPLSVDAFTAPNDRTTVHTPVMKWHQRNWRDGNQLIVSTLLRSFRQPKDFDSTLWLSQIQQADGVLTGVEHWRRDWPHSTGSLVWQFDDCWPSISWSMVDYYGRPKALYYRVKHAYAPVALSGLADSKTGQAELWVTNDRREAKRGRIDWKLWRLDGTVAAKGSQAVAISAGTSSVRALTLATKGGNDILLSATLTTPGEPDSSTVLRFARPKDLNLRDPKVRASVVVAEGGYQLTLTAARPSPWTWVDLAGMDATYSDNFVALFPGQPATILIHPTSKTTLAQVRKALKVQSLYNTYLPGTEATPTVNAGNDGSIVATADNAEILGDGAILEVGTPSNIGNWQNPEDSLRWTVRNAKSGLYAVKAVVAIPENEAGSTFDVEVEGQHVVGKVPGTKSWWDYKEIDLGTLRIEREGNIQILLKPTMKKSTHVMNLRSITLTRVSDR